LVMKFQQSDKSLKFLLLAHVSHQKVICEDPAVLAHFIKLRTR